MIKTNISIFQEQFWLLYNLAKTSSAYNIPSIFKLDKKPDIKILNEALTVLVNRYESLRTSFKMENNEPYQYIATIHTVKIEVIEVITHKNSDENSGTLPAEIYNEVHKLFDLSVAPLLRVKLFDYNGTFFLTIVFHHIIVDLHSKNIFANDLSSLYNSLIKSESIKTHLTTLHYSDFSKWHNNWIGSADALKMVEEWENGLPESNTLLNLPLDFDRPVVPTMKGTRNYFQIDKNLSAKINEYAVNKSTTSFIVLLSSYAILLNKLSRQDLVLIGVPLSNRRKEDFKDTFGCFVNILPIVIDFSNSPAISDIRDQIRQKLLLAHRKQEIPFFTILNSGKGKRNTSYNPYFQTGFTFEPPMNLELNDIKTENLPIEKEGSQLDLFLTMWEEEEQFSGYLEYATDLFSSETAGRFKECFVKIVEHVVEDDKKISEISILPETDKQRLLDWNRTEFDVNTSICLHQKFEEQVVEFPDNIAVSFNSEQLTYSEFNKHANRLAHFLIDSGVKIEDVVCVCLERSIELVVSLFAIHKAGGAYLPVDPDYPAERLDTILDDARPKFIITTQKNSKNLEKHTNKIFIDTFLESPLSDKDTNPNLAVSSKNLAYLLYTSGSTGKSKGVMIEHHSVINKLEWMQNQHPLDKSDTIVLKTPVTFDVSVWELFWWFFNGAKLTLLPVNGEKDPKTIADIVENQKVTTIIFVPSMFSPFVEYIKTKQIVAKLYSLKYIVQIGEALSPQLVMNFNELRNTDFSPLLVNTYGPTEATVAVSYYNCPESGQIQKIFIGKPIYNTKLLIIDKDNAIQPIGVPGELVISGTNLSRGYLNRPELNNERFININGFDGNELRVYKTGDLVKWTENGELDFIGRLDNQVKIRGYRIELGDIEAKILEHNCVKTAAVVVHSINNTDMQLVGYVVLKENIACTTAEIKKHLSSKLPDYMVPSLIMIIDKMPLITSGKIDRKSLPKPEMIFEKEMIEPKSKIEKELSLIWCKLLNLKSVGINNNFFDIGGNSLTAIRMVTELKESLNINIEPLILMQYPNIRELAAYLAKMDSGSEEEDEYNIRIRRRDFSRLRNKLN